MSESDSSFSFWGLFNPSGGPINDTSGSDAPLIASSRSQEATTAGKQSSGENVNLDGYWGFFTDGNQSQASASPAPNTTMFGRMLDNAQQQQQSAAIPGSGLFGGLSDWFGGVFGGGSAASGAQAAGQAAAQQTAASTGVMQSAQEWLSGLFSGNDSNQSQNSGGIFGAASGVGSWLGGLFKSTEQQSGEEAATDTLNQLASGVTSAGGAVSDGLRSLFARIGGAPGTSSQAATNEGLSAFFGKIQEYANSGDPAQRNVAQQALGALMNLQPSSVPSDILSKVNSFVRSFNGGAAPVRDRSTPADAPNTPTPDFAPPAPTGGSVFDFGKIGDALGLGGGDSSGYQQASNQQLATVAPAASTGLMGMLWSDVPPVVTTAGAKGILEVETNTPLLRRSILIAGIPIPISLLLVGGVLLFVYRKKVKAWWKKSTR